MNFVVSEIKTRRKETYPNMNGDDRRSIDAVNARMLTVGEYNDLARRIIGKWAPVQSRQAMLNSEDAIDHVAHLIMIGDWGYESSKSDIKTYRGYCGKRAIQDWLGKLTEQQSVAMKNTLDDNDPSHTSLYDFIGDPKSVPADVTCIFEEQRQENRERLRSYMEDLNDTQKSCVAMYYIEDMAMPDIGEELGITREGVRKAIVEGIAIMRKKAMGGK